MLAFDSTWVHLWLVLMTVSYGLRSWRSIRRKLQQLLPSQWNKSFLPASREKDECHITAEDVLGLLPPPNLRGNSHIQYKFNGARAGTRTRYRTGTRTRGKAGIKTRAGLVLGLETGLVLGLGTGLVLGLGARLVLRLGAGLVLGLGGKAGTRT